MLKTFKRIRDELTARFPRIYVDELEHIEKEAEETLESVLGGLSSSQLQGLLEIIRYRRGMISTSAAYGNEVVSISKQILAFGGAGIGLVAAFSHNLAELPSPILKSLGVAALFYFNLIVLSLITILEFVWITRYRYPFLYFKRIGNTIPFFYYQAISPEVPRSEFQTSKEKLLASELYGKDLINFVRHLIPYSEETPENDEEVQLRLRRREVRDELQQYFLLISYQGYVNQFEVRMNNAFLYGLIAAILSAVAVAVFAFFKGI